MAASYMASMLDELMGRNRDQPPDQKGKEKTWDDTQVCKHYLCGFCPNELFINTRADLGPCDKIHDDAYKKEYEESSRFEKMGYEEDFLRFLQSLLSDVERRIRRGHQRLALSTQPSGGASSFTSQKEEKVEMLTQRINDLVEQIEELGCEGKVEEAQGVMKLCDQLKEEREQLENRVEQHTVPSMKDMEVCDVCGAFLILGDAQQRLEEHLMGKQHMGFAKVRVTVENIKNKLRGRDAEREARLAKEREDREKEREREREERQLRREEREKEREKERERRKKKSRSRSRGRRSRSRSRTKKSRSRERERSRDRGDRDRDRGDRERERGRDHDRGDRDRDRDRDRRRRSRSRDRHRSRSRDRHHRSRSRSRGHSRHSSSSKRRSRSKERRSHRSRSHEKRRERESKDRDSKHNETPEKESKSRDEPSLNGDHSKEVEDSSNHGVKPVMGVAPMEEQITSAVPDPVAAPTEAAAGLVEGDSN